MNSSNYMQSFISGLIVILFLVLTPLFPVNSAQAAELEAKISFGDSTAKLDKKGTVQINGSGFKPGNVVNVTFVGDDGVTADVEWALDPLPVAGEDGTWSTTWDYGRFVSKKLITGGTYKITVSDEEYTPLASAELKFEE